MHKRIVSVVVLAFLYSSHGQARGADEKLLGS